MPILQSTVLAPASEAQYALYRGPNTRACSALVRGEYLSSSALSPLICVGSEVAMRWREEKRRLQIGSASCSMVSHHHMSSCTYALPSFTLLCIESGEGTTRTGPSGTEGKLGLLEKIFFFFINPLHDINKNNRHIQGRHQLAVDGLTRHVSGRADARPRRTDQPNAP